VNQLSLSSYNPADPFSLGSVVQGSCTGRSGLCCDYCSNSLGRLGLVSIRFIDRSFPGPRGGWPYELWGPWAFREVFYPYGGPRGYLSPTSPRSLGRFWNERPKDPRSSLQFLILTRDALEISLPGHSFWVLNDPVETLFHCLFLPLLLEIRCSVSDSCFGSQHLCTIGLQISLGAPNG
jgi:hypothetical protein